MNYIALQLELGIATFLLAYVSIAFLRRWAQRRMLDIPNSRSSHTRPTPRGGGIGIVISLLIGLWISYWLQYQTLSTQTIVTFSIGAIFIALVSWLDDMNSLSSVLRLFVHINSAILVLVGIGFLHTIVLPFDISIELGWLGIPLTFLWLTYFINAYNFMDGIDGIAATQAVVAGCAWVGLGVVSNEPLVSLLGILVASSSLGFLGHNWPPASIFMGDVGSAFLGYTLASLPIIANLSNPQLAMAGLLIVWPFVFDTAFTLLRRLSRGENIFESHRSHLYQRLVIAGYSHRSTTLLYACLALVGVLLAHLWVLEIISTGWLLLGIPFLLCLLLWCLVIYAEHKSTAIPNQQLQSTEDKSSMSQPTVSSSPPLIGLRVRYLMTVDLFLILLAIVFAFVVRYEALIAIEPYLWRNWTYLLLAPFVWLPTFYFFQLYNRMWRYASMREMGTIVGASFVSAIITFALNFGFMPLTYALYMPSRSIWLLQSIFSMLFLAGIRMLLRLIQERYRPHELAQLRAFAQNPSKLLIVGAGDAGAMLARELQNNAKPGLHIVGFVDDNPAKNRLSVHSIPVLGNRNNIAELVTKYDVTQIVIAMPTAPGREIRDIVRICEESGISPRTIPGIYELLDGTVSLNQVRNLKIEDLLRRAPIQTDTVAVRERLQGKRVLVTGGGGSIGSELCRQILRCQPAELILLGHGENSVFEIQQELSNLLKNNTKSDNVAVPVLHSFIADIRFPDRILSIFKQVRPEIVFHAAAHKHVPLMEMNPVEAITNNVLGTRNILKAALAVNVQQFVMISTDKAVNPTSIMGASKRAAELLVHQAALQSHKPYMAVRFGNVLGSRGSVVLTFQKQIAAGGPITITHPEMKRFFMTIPEATQLVLQASALGHGGEVFLLDMGEPVKIVDLARDLIELSGLEVGRDIDIVFTGLRPGEKLYEELFVPGENYHRTQHEKIYIAANASSFVPEGLDQSVAALELAANSEDNTTIVRCLQSLIPEFQPPKPEKISASVAEGSSASHLTLSTVQST